MSLGHSIRRGLRQAILQRGTQILTVDTPEKMLLVNIVIRALWDLTLKRHTPDRIDATVWLLSKSKLEFSFYWICDALSEDPRQLRKQILKLVHNGREKQGHLADGHKHSKPRIRISSGAN